MEQCGNLCLISGSKKKKTTYKVGAGKKPNSQFMFL